MSSVARKLLQVQPSAEASGPVYVNDVFSSTAFEGNSSASASGFHTNVNLEVPLTTSNTTRTFARWTGSNEYARPIVGSPNSNGDILVIAQFDDYSFTKPDKMMKVKKDGTIAWWKDVPAGMTLTRDIVGDPSSTNFYVFARDNNSGANRNTLVKFDADGGIVYQKYMDAQIEQGGYLHVDSSGNLYIAINRIGTSVVTPYPMGIMKLNSSGTVQWTKKYYHASDRAFVWRPTTDSSGNVFLSGSLYSNTSQEGMIVTKLDSSGNSQWSGHLRAIDVGGLAQGKGAVTDSSGNVYVLGHENDGTNWKVLLAKFNSSGTKQFLKQAAPTYSIPAQQIETDGTYIYVRCSSTEGGTYSGILILVYDTDGDLVTQKIIHTKDRLNPISGQGMAVGSDGTVYITGGADDPGGSTYGPMYFVIQDFINTNGDFGEFVVQDTNITSAERSPTIAQSTPASWNFGSETVSFTNGSLTFPDTSVDEQIMFSDFIQIGPSESDGGMVWLKTRNAAGNHFIFDTERGVTKYISTNNTDAEATDANTLTSFNPFGFTVGPETAVNRYTDNIAAWTFRKYPGFFDVVTYTGDGTDGRQIAHNLNSTIGFLMVKNLDTAGWYFYGYHRSLGAGSHVTLGATSAVNTSSNLFKSSGTYDDSVFTVGDGAAVNASGTNYVAYLFAHDAQNFGTDSDESIIKCGSYTGTGSAQDIDLGFEPQWILIKRTNTSGSWILLDSMRGIAADNNDPDLHPNDNNYESQQGAVNFAQLNVDGIKIDPGSNGYTGVNANGSTYIYVAIRRPNKPASNFHPTQLFQVANGDISASESPKFRASFSPDLFIERQVASTGSVFWGSRLTGNRYLISDSTQAEVINTDFLWGYNNGVVNYFSTAGYYAWMFRRAPGFFDVVTYTGTGSARTVSHNLGVAPELMIIKNRDRATHWTIYSSDLGISYHTFFNSAASVANGDTLYYFNSTAPTESVFSVGTGGYTNENGEGLIAYLFASVSGISKVGTFTRTSGDTTNVDCGFTNGARFVMFKRVSGGTGNWTIYDNLRGINSGNDPYFFLNNNVANVTTTNYIDHLSSGFQVESGIATGTFLFLAIA